MSGRKQELIDKLRAKRFPEETIEEVVEAVFGGAQTNDAPPDDPTDPDPPPTKPDPTIPPKK